ncbi:MAG: pseudouridine synthase [Anaerolineae bacterium]
MSADRGASSGERLQKVLAHAGVASRRRCEEIIEAGRVRVNGKVVMTLGTRVDPGRDRIEVDGQPIHRAAKLYYALHKPAGVISTVRDPHGRLTARALVPTDECVYPVGRLDRDSEGLLLFTNDGALAQRLMHPRYEHEKQYYALVSGIPMRETLAALREGILLPGEDRPMTAEAHRLPATWHWRGHRAPNGSCWLDVILREGRKREIRRLLRATGHEVQRLVRVRISTLRLGDLEPGQGRWLADEEIASLRRAAGLERT